MRSELFDHISNQKVRERSSQDFAELKKCIRSKTWKAAILLAGSLIESVLYDAISSSFPNELSNENNITLFNLLRWAKSCGIINEGVFRFADQIRNYRNLIHPNVYLRDDMEVSENVTTISFNVLLEIIRLTKKHNKESQEKNTKNVIMRIIKDNLSRKPSDSDFMIYTPILDKYGLEKGKKIIERSINFGKVK